MMGDDMAIRSGGMYGNPESNYTLAMPMSGGSGLGGALSIWGKGVKIGFGVMSSYGKYLAEKRQVQTDLEVLRKEKEYNIKNFQQNIADTFAKNKMSFYASGLDLTGSALSVARENKRALTEDLRMMEYNYRTQEESLKERQRAARGSLLSNITNSVLSAF